MQRKNNFPRGGDEFRVRKVIEHYERQSDDDAVAEDQSITRGSSTIMKAPSRLVPQVRRLIAREARTAKKR